MHVSFRSVSLDCLQLANLPPLTLLPYAVTWHHVADVKSSLAITCFSRSLDTPCSRKCGSCHENSKIESNSCDFSKAWGFQQKHFKETNMFQTEQLPPTNGKLKYIQVRVLWKHLLTKARNVMPFGNNTPWAHHVDILPHLPWALHLHDHGEDTTMNFIPLSGSEVSCFEDRYIHWLEMFPGGRGSFSGTFRRMVRSSHGLRRHGVFSYSEQNLEVIQYFTNPGQRYTI